MLSIFQIVVPTPYAVGPVNAYLVRNEPMTLIDVGPGTPEAVKTVKNMLEAIGVRINDIKRVVITHSHPDHCGMVPEIAAVAETTVLLHAQEAQKLTARHDYVQERLPFAIEAGIPPTALKEMFGAKDKLPRPDMSKVNVQILNDGDKLEFLGGQLHVYHLPGHSPGHLCLYDPVDNTFFSGDFLLPHITPNPVIEPDPVNKQRRLPTLKQYLSGLEKIEKLKVRMVCPGHGGVFSNHQMAIDVARRHHRHQFKTILDKLAIEKLSCYQLSHLVYPNLKGWEIFLGLSEIQAHLDYLAGQKAIGKTFKDGVCYYEKLGHATGSNFMQRVMAGEQ